MKYLLTIFYLLSLFIIIQAITNKNYINHLVKPMILLDIFHTSFRMNIANFFSYIGIFYVFLVPILTFFYPKKLRFYFLILSIYFLILEPIFSEYSLSYGIFLFLDRLTTVSVLFMIFIFYKEKFIKKETIK